MEMEVERRKVVIVLERDPGTDLAARVLQGDKAEGDLGDSSSPEEEESSSSEEEEEDLGSYLNSALKTDPVLKGIEEMMVTTLRAGVSQVIKRALALTALHQGQGQDLTKGSLENGRMSSQRQRQRQRKRRRKKKTAVDPEGGNDPDHEGDTDIDLDLEGSNRSSGDEGQLEDQRHRHRQRRKKKRKKKTAVDLDPDTEGGNNLDIDLEGSNRSLGDEEEGSGVEEIVASVTKISADLAKGSLKKKPKGPLKKGPLKPTKTVNRDPHPASAIKGPENKIPPGDEDEGSGVNVNVKTSLSDKTGLDKCNAKGPETVTAGSPRKIPPGDEDQGSGVNVAVLTSGEIGLDNGNNKGPEGTAGSTGKIPPGDENPGSGVSVNVAVLSLTSGLEGSHGQVPLGSPQEVLDLSLGQTRKIPPGDEEVGSGGIRTRTNVDMELELDHLSLTSGSEDGPFKGHDLNLDLDLHIDLRGKGQGHQEEQNPDEMMETETFCDKEVDLKAVPKTKGSLTPEVIPVDLALEDPCPPTPQGTTNEDNPPVENGLEEERGPEVKVKVSHVDPSVVTSSPGDHLTFEEPSVPQGDKDKDNSPGDLGLGSQSQSPQEGNWDKKSRLVTDASSSPGGHGHDPDPDPDLPQTPQGTSSHIIPPVEIENDNGKDKAADSSSAEEELPPPEELRPPPPVERSRRKVMSKVKYEVEVKVKVKDPPKKPLPSCYFCQKVLRNQSTLERHLTTHTGEKPFKCPICFQEFAAKGHLNSHVKGHRKVTVTPKRALKGPKSKTPAKKPFCDTEFAAKGHRTVTRTVTQGALKGPLKKTKGPPFFCVHAGCGKRFISQLGREIHHRAHTGEKPFPCPLKGCGRAFTSSSHLAYHRRSCETMSPSTRLRASATASASTLKGPETSRNGKIPPGDEGPSKGVMPHTSGLDNRKGPETAGSRKIPPGDEGSHTGGNVVSLKAFTPISHRQKCGRKEIAAKTTKTKPSLKGPKTETAGSTGKIPPGDEDEGSGGNVAPTSGLERSQVPLGSPQEALDLDQTRKIPPGDDDQGSGVNVASLTSGLDNGNDKGPEVTAGSRKIPPGDEGSQSVERPFACPLKGCGKPFTSSSEVASHRKTCIKNSIARRKKMALAKGPETAGSIGSTAKIPPEDEGSTGKFPPGDEGSLTVVNVAAAALTSGLDESQVPSGSPAEALDLDPTEKISPGDENEGSGVNVNVAVLTSGFDNAKGPETAGSTGKFPPGDEGSGGSVFATLTSGFDSQVPLDLGLDLNPGGESMSPDPEVIPRDLTLTFELEQSIPLDSEGTMVITTHDSTLISPVSYRIIQGPLPRDHFTPQGNENNPPVTLTVTSTSPSSSNIPRDHFTPQGNGNNPPVTSTSPSGIPRDPPAPTPQGNGSQGSLLIPQGNRNNPPVTSSNSSQGPLPRDQPTPQGNRNNPPVTCDLSSPSGSNRNSLTMPIQGSFPRGHPTPTPRGTKLNNPPVTPGVSRRPFKCRYKGCPSSFISEAHLRKHAMVHWGKRSLFPCPFKGCGKGFLTLLGRDSHLRAHNKGSKVVGKGSLEGVTSKQQPQQKQQIQEAMNLATATAIGTMGPEGSKVTEKGSLKGSKVVGNGTGTLEGVRTMSTPQKQKQQFEQAMKLATATAIMTGGLERGPEGSKVVGTEALEGSKVVGNGALEGVKSTSQQQVEAMKMATATITTTTIVPEGSKVVKNGPLEGVTEGSKVMDCPCPPTPQGTTNEDNPPVENGVEEEVGPEVKVKVKVSQGVIRGDPSELTSSPGGDNSDIVGNGTPIGLPLQSRSRDGDCDLEEPSVTQGSKENPPVGLSPEGENCVVDILADPPLPSTPQGNGPNNPPGNYNDNESSAEEELPPPDELIPPPPEEPTSKAKVKVKVKSRSRSRSKVNAPPRKKRKLEKKKKHICYFCSKQLPDLWHLERHLTTHTNERPFKCPKCREEFVDKWRLKRHTERQHKVKGQGQVPPENTKPLFTCPFPTCGKTFTLQRSCDNHLRAHST